MKNLFALLFVVSIVFYSCDDTPEVIPDVIPDVTAEGLSSDLQTALDEKVTSDATATGADESVFDGWTLAYNSSQLTNKPSADAAEGTEAPTEDVDADITADVTWTKDKVWVLKDRITVLDGVTLTIEAGTVVKGDASLSGADAAVLMIARGGKIEAVGTADAPIIMTSTEDDVQPGGLKGTELNQDSKGKWGGLVILGKAPVSAKVDEPQIEGVDASDSNGLYGGSDAADNSGTLQYVSIRHGGAEIATDSEINGLTLGGVGTGTTIENIEIYGNSDDGVEFFGGTVNASNVLVYAVGDDALDIDQSYAGTVSNFLVYVDENSDEGLEIDGREGSMSDKFTLTNGTILSASAAKTVSADFKSKAQGAVENVILKDGNIKLSFSFDATELKETEDASTNLRDGSLSFTKCSFDKLLVYIND